MEAWCTRAQSIHDYSRFQAFLHLLSLPGPISRRDLADLGLMRASVPPEKEGELKGMAESG